MRLNEKTNRMERRAVRFSFAIKKNALARLLGDPKTADLLKQLVAAMDK